jgi:g-D-glutamyl-meso-diaminopimelate peptidase
MCKVFFISSFHISSNGIGGDEMASEWKEYAQMYGLPECILVDSNCEEDDSEHIRIPGHMPSQEGMLFRIFTPLVRYKAPYTYERLQEDISLLKQVYPFMNVSSIGKSVLGKDLFALQIGHGAKKVQMNASFHANEWLTTSLLMRFVNEYMLALTNNECMRGMDAMSLYENVSLHLVPMVNPDGVNLVVNKQVPSKTEMERVYEINNAEDDFTWWKANINGVDLNNQFPAKWEIEKERKLPKTYAPRDYPGDEPLSEPEAIAMAEVAHKEQFDLLVALHSQGKEIYWGYEGYEPSYAGTIVAEMERVSGYKAIQHIDSHAGYRDWFIQEFQRPGFTVEVGKGINPLPLSTFDSVYEECRNILIASMYMSLKTSCS